MRSIRCPKRITVRGDDEREYRYLVKCGEDLRQDQRIEQLLQLMNDIYSQHAACTQRHLRIRTYQVVPMTPRYLASFLILSLSISLSLCLSICLSFFNGYFSR